MLIKPHAVHRLWFSCTHSGPICRWLCFLDSKQCGWPGFALLKEQRGYIKSTSGILFKLFISTAQTWVRLFNSHYRMRVLSQKHLFATGWMEPSNSILLLFSDEKLKGFAWSLKLKCVICQCYDTFSYPSLMCSVDNASWSLIFP